MCLAVPGQVLEIVGEIFPLVGAEYAQGEADQRPHVNNRVIAPVMFTQLMNLSMAVMTSCNTVIRSGCLDLGIF